MLRQFTDNLQGTNRKTVYPRRYWSFARRNH